MYTLMFFVVAVSVYLLTKKNPDDGTARKLLKWVLALVLVVLLVLVKWMGNVLLSIR